MGQTTLRLRGGKLVCERREGVGRHRSTVPLEPSTRVDAVEDAARWLLAAAGASLVAGLASLVLGEITVAAAFGFVAALLAMLHGASKTVELRVRPNGDEETGIEVREQGSARETLRDFADEVREARERRPA